MFSDIINLDFNLSFLILQLYLILTIMIFIQTNALILIYAFVWIFFAAIKYVMQVLSASQPSSNAIVLS